MLSERVGDLSCVLELSKLRDELSNTNFQYELSKLFKPVTDLKEGLVSELKPIREGMKILPKAIPFLQFPSMIAYDDDGEED